MSNASVKPGDVLAGKYRVEKILGAGGMGYVVAARHLQLDQLVAMKFLRKGAIENTEAGARFLREAKAVVKLKNEHVAKVFDVGHLESGEPYIVMEHLDGCDLSAMAKERHSLPAEEACEYILQACEALAEAHSLGIIHRDIKLANLFVTRGPAGGALVKVLDFGISKTNPFGESEHDMTRTASMLGSPRFMSPEQMRDPRAVDGRSDIWSLGVVLYRLVAGRPPFEADTLGRLLTMVMHEQEMPLASVRKDIPPGFSEVVAHCLQKDPAVRFATVADLARALVPFCLEPERARASADRIAAVLSMPNSNRSDISHPLPLPTGPTGPVQPRMASMHSTRNSARQSRPPGASDTGGTASPWASGTHNALKPRGNTTTIIAAIALAVLLVGSIGVAQWRRQNAETKRLEAAAAAARATAVVAANPPPATPPTTPVSATTPAPEPTPPPPAPTVAATTPAAPTTGVPVKTEPTSRRPPPPAPRPTTRPSPPPRPTPAPKSGDEIPGTRD